MDRRSIEERLCAMAAAANLSPLQQAWCLEAVGIIGNLREVIDSRDKALGFEPIPDSAIPNEEKS